MLSRLYIQNYALIRELDINFSNGFSVITGETGAGKSILLGALGLLMGNRADAKSISENSNKCVIEGEFTLQNQDLNETHYEYVSTRDWFEENELDWEEVCVIRREISATGKSRAFINDTPVTIAQLKELGQQLIDIHSQHENLLLQDDAFQLGLVDAIADNSDLQSTYSAAYQQYTKKQKELEALLAESTKQQKDLDYIAFQVQQLQEAKVQNCEEVGLEQEQDILTHSEEIKTQLALASGWLSEEEKALSSVREALSALRKIAPYIEKETLLNNVSTAEESITRRLESTWIELKDIAETVEDLAEKTEYDPERLQVVGERLDLINSLLQKHRVQNTTELLQVQAELEKQLNKIENYDEELKVLKQQADSYLLATVEAAKQLTASRKKVIPTIEKHLTQELTQLGIPNAKVQLQVTELAEFTPSGKDDIQLLFSANKNGTLRNVAEVASGGEIARLMLCIKALLAQKKQLPTLIFDEIDTGVSGEIASRMGHIMQQMGEKMQLISITHLPQIAALGATHYKVYKQDNEDFTESHIICLNNEERVQEIAQMLSGSEVTKEAVANAKRLLFSLPSLHEGKPYAG